ncbi:hypothetical protein SNE40_023340 [Patella caerulea]|uniref:Post-GPI attachment to proteins factor 3 n=1 Tax=Patella caerulea TaxID=87958 RepID=A0AAN8GBZ3_PATCE
MEDVLKSSFIFLLLMIISQTGCQGSIGDRSYRFMKCLIGCTTINCSKPHDFLAKQPLHLKVLQWDCESECRYSCMWSTVDAFEKDGLKIPQFNGKWPFIRLFGIQEPASVLFSTFNAMCCLGIFYFRRKISPNVPMYYVWHIVSLVSLNAWIWSIVFHTRDTDITEKLDYYFAFSIVCCNIWSFMCRYFGTNSWYKTGIFTTIIITIYLYHIYYLHYIDMDYGYNVTVNITLGILNTILWSIWSLYRIKKQPYLWKCLLAILAVPMLLLLELFDFPPIYWCLDAHALWHAGTVPFALMWISFIVDDCRYLQEKQEESLLKLD